MERLEALNPQRTIKNKRSLDSPSHPPAKNHGALAAQVPTSQDNDHLKRFSGSHDEMRRVASESAYSRAASGQRRQANEPFHAFRARHSGSPSQFMHRSVPLYPAEVTHHKAHGPLQAGFRTFFRLPIGHWWSQFARPVSIDYRGC